MSDQPQEEIPPVSSEESTPAPEAPAETPVETVAETDAAPAEAAEATGDVPQLTLGSGEDAPESESAEPAEYVQPTIRGRIDKFGTAIGTGRRKTSVARVRVKDGDGKVTINGRELNDFFRLDRDRKMVMAPVEAVGETGKIDIWVRVSGGGITGQTGAVVLGIARALQAKNESFHGTLAEGGYLTRDDRMVERKKYGLAKARRSFQFSKR